MKLLLMLAVLCLAVGAFFASAAQSDEPMGEEAKPAVQPPRPRLTLSREVTFFTEPLAADGLIDYAAALNRRFGEGVTPENNAAVAIVRAMGPRNLEPEELDKLCKKLGIESLPSKDRCFVPLDDFVDEARSDLERDEAATIKRLTMTRQQILDQLARDDWSEAAKRCGQARWSAADEPLVAAWLDRIAKPLELLKAAGQMRRFFVPCDNDAEYGGMLGSSNVALPTLWLVDAMRARAMMSLAAGNTDAAWNDVLAIRRWGGRACDAKMLIDQLVGIALIRDANAAACTIAANSKLGDEQLQAMQAEWDSARDGPTLGEAFDVGERCFGLHAMNLVFRASLDPRSVQSLDGISGPPPAARNERGWLRTLVGMFFDWDSAFVTINRQYDKLASILRLPRLTERREAARRYEDDIERLAAQRMNPYLWFSIATLDHRSRRTAAARYFSGSWVAARTLPAVAAIIESDGKSSVERALVGVTFALARHRAVHGAFPENLADLVPNFLDKLPADDFGEGPLEYRRRDDGGFELYSVGPNGKDDGGRSDQPLVDTTSAARDETENDGDADDLVIRIGGLR